MSLKKTSEAEVIELCQKLVRINSINPPGNELAVAKLAAEALTAAGIPVEYIPHEEGRSSLIAWIKGSGEIPGLMYSGHLDTVPVGASAWKHDPLGAEIIDGKIWGRGSADMKGGVAALITAAITVAKSGAKLKGDLVLALSAGEEVNLLGARSLVEHPLAQNLQAVFVAEPTSNDLVLAEKGNLWLRIITHGKTAHGAMPHLGNNAILSMMHLLQEFQTMAIDSQEHPLLGKFTRSINTIQGGVKTNVVPDACEVTIDMRTVPGQDCDLILKQVGDLISRLEGEDSSIKADFNLLGPPSSALSTDPDLVVVQQFKTIVEEVRRQTIDPIGVNYLTDAVIYVPRLNIPMIVCGPGAAGMAHQPNEYVEVSSLLDSAHIYTRTAQQLLT